MPGLDPAIVSSIDWSVATSRVLLDTRTDLILAPHYTAVFEKSGAALADILQVQLRSGNYSPSLPLIANVPKERGFTRPGVVLNPLDRLCYQALVDHCLPEIEAQFDRTRAFSHVPSDNAENLFEPNHDGWGAFQGKLVRMCADGGSFVRADVANYFERIPQHHLINLMAAAGCDPPAVRLLEEMLLAFRERNSFGIVQGVYSSDILGNFYLTELDAFYSMNGVDTARYVDDLFIRFDADAAAKDGLVQLIDRLRRSGLHLNEGKSGIFPATQILQEETEVDELFDQARSEAEAELSSDAIYAYYGLATNWEVMGADSGEVDLAAVRNLLDARTHYPKSWDKIVRFALPTLAAAHSEYALDIALQELRSRPHLSRIYLTYLRAFVATNNSLTNELVRYLEGDFPKSNYDLMYLFGTLLSATAVPSGASDVAVRKLLARGEATEMRAVAAIFAAKHGTAAQKLLVRRSYEDEPSEYVRAAILYGASFFTGAERATCKRAWGGHGVINSLIAASI